jgi:hypothetical protein
MHPMAFFSITCLAKYESHWMTVACSVEWNSSTRSALAISCVA